MSKDKVQRSLNSVKDELTFVLNTMQGRRFFFWLVDQVCGLHAASYAGGREDTFYREGRRAVGIELMTAAQECAPALYRQSLIEALSDRELDTLVAKQSADEENDNG